LHKGRVGAGVPLARYGRDNRTYNFQKAG